MARLAPLLADLDAQRALGVLRRDFRDHDAVGPRGAAEFLSGAIDEVIQADVVGVVERLLEACDAIGG